MNATVLSLMAALAALGGSASAAQLFYEGFDYTPSATLNGQNGGTGFTGPWVEGGAAGDLDLVQSGSLVFGTLATAGNSVASRAPVSLTSDLSREIVDIAGTTGSTLWLSFLTRKDSAGGTAPEDYFGLVLYPTAGDALFIGDPFENDFYSLGVAGESAGLVASNVAVTPSNTAFLVVKISFLNGPDRIELFVNPTAGSTAPTLASATKTDLNLGDISLIGVIGGSSTADPLRSYDEIRAGTTFADVAPIPEPSTAALAALGVLLLNVRRSCGRTSAAGV